MIKETIIEKICGVYLLTNKESEKVYVGSSTDINRRYKHHLSSLKNNKHHNILLQREYNDNKQISLSLSILCYCTKEDLKKNEQYWMDYYQSYNPKYGYNVARSTSYVPNKLQEYSGTKEYELLMSLVLYASLKEAVAAGIQFSCTTQAKENMSIVELLLLCNTASAIICNISYYDPSVAYKIEISNEQIGDTYSTNILACRRTKNMQQDIHKYLLRYIWDSMTEETFKCLFPKYKYLCYNSGIEHLIEDRNI